MWPSQTTGEPHDSLSFVGCRYPLGAILDKLAAGRDIGPSTYSCDWYSNVAVRDEKWTFEKNLQHLMEEGFPVTVVLDTRSGNHETSLVSGFVKGVFGDFIHVVRDPTSDEIREHGSNLVGIDIPKRLILTIV